MLAAVFKAEGRLALEERPEPALEAPDDVVIEVEACGICGTDLQILAEPPGHPARPGVVLGHEFVGRVAFSGPAASELQPGQRVVVDPDPKCGRCSSCRAGRPADCERIEALGVVRDGALARWTKAPAAAVYPLSDDPSSEEAALIEPLACVINGVNRAAPRPGESALVLGAGSDRLPVCRCSPRRRLLAGRRRGAGGRTASGREPGRGQCCPGARRARVCPQGAPTRRSRHRGRRGRNPV